MRGAAHTAHMDMVRITCARAWVFEEVCNSELSVLIRLVDNHTNNKHTLVLLEPEGGGKRILQRGRRVY